MFFDDEANCMKQSFTSLLTIRKDVLLSHFFTAAITIFRTTEMSVNFMLRHNKNN